MSLTRSFPRKRESKSDRKKAFVCLAKAGSPRPRGSLGGGSTSTHNTLTHDPPDPLLANDRLSVWSCAERIEDDARAAKNVIEWNVTHRCHDPAIGRVIAIVAHHEDISRRHDVFRR